MRSRVGESAQGGSREAPMVLISRNAELGDVSDFGGQSPRSARRGHVCFSPLGPPSPRNGSDFTRPVWLFSCQNLGFIRNSSEGPKNQPHSGKHSLQRESLRGD